MTKNEIITVTLKDMGLPRLPEHEEPFNDDPDDEELVIAELQLILPATDDIKTCEDFAYLNVACCKICHTFYPNYDMCLVDLPGGEQAWVCCSVRSAVTHSTAGRR